MLVEEWLGEYEVRFEESDSPNSFCYYVNHAKFEL